VTSARGERIARNHGLFREVNQRIVSLTEEFGLHRSHDGGGLALVCECGNGVVERNGRYIVVERTEASSR
jgi:hypothetical protein